MSLFAKYVDFNSSFAELVIEIVCIALLNFSLMVRTALICFLST